MFEFGVSRSVMAGGVVAIVLGCPRVRARLCARSRACVRVVCGGSRGRLVGSVCFLKNDVY